MLVFIRLDSEAGKSTQSYLTGDSHNVPEFQSQFVNGGNWVGVTDLVASRGGRFSAFGF